jgi:hypothetical protein
VVVSGVRVGVKDANGDAIAGTTTYDATTRTATFRPAAPLPGFVQHTVTLSGEDAAGLKVSSGQTWSFTTARPPGAPGVCPCSLFADTLVPTLVEDVDRTPVTLGVRFTSDVAGSVTAVRFYKGVNNTGTHTGTLWSASGTKLAEGTFTNESTTGWQTLTFATPVTIAKNTQYVASYRTEVGRYSATPNAFATTDLSRAPLRVSASAGAYTYGTGFPSSSSPTSYLVDVVFERPEPQIAISAQDPAPNALDIPRGAPIKVSFSDPVAPGWSLSATQQPSGAAIAGTAVLEPDGTALTFTPSSLLPPETQIKVVLSGVRSVDGAVLATQTWSFTTRGPDSATAQSLFSDQVPTVAAADESSPVELGTEFTPSRDGKVTGIRFFKGAGNLGTHVGSLWSASGQRLATVTFAGESAGGWQTATVSPAVDVSAGSRYVVSYLAPQGHYSYTPGFCSAPCSAGLLTAPAGMNGRYLYGAAGGYPAYSYGAANYFVDVVFEPAPPSLEIAGRDPAPGATDVPRSTTPTVELSAPLADGWAMSVRDGTTPVPGTASLSADGTALTFTPADRLPADRDLTVSLSGAVSTGGAVLPSTAWTFHTETGSTVLTSMFSGSVPTNPSINDAGPIELGTAFTPSSDGTVTAVRFYKGSGNTGVHTGSVWSSSGQRLGTVTFADETGSGWQTARLASPVALTAGETYVVSYYAPRGHYSGTPGFFNSAWTVGPLTAGTTSNGRFSYADGGGFPTGSWNQTNYFVDVVFRSSTP